MIQNCQNQNPKMHDIHGLWLQFKDDDNVVLYSAIHDRNTISENTFWPILQE